MVLKIVILFLIPTLVFSGEMNLKETVEKVEREGSDNLTGERVNKLKVILSDAEDADVLDFDELEDRLNAVIDSWQKKKISGGWNIFVNMMTWTYAIELPLINNEIFSDEHGACGGAGYDWQNAYYGFGIDLCVGGMRGKSSVTILNAITVQIDLPVFMMTSKPKIFWRPGEHTRLVFYLPLIYRYGFSSDNIYERSLEGGKFSIGLFLGGEWEISDIVLGSSIGKIIGYESTSLNFTLGYRF